MTRINTIEPKLLTDQHLLAEYREMPRVASYLAKNPYVDIPKDYRMGAGHIKFFYNKAHYLVARHAAIMTELNARRFNLTQKQPYDFGPMFEQFVLQGGWKPSVRDHRINIKRLLECIKANPGKYTMIGRPLNLEQYEQQLKQILE